MDHFGIGAAMRCMTEVYFQTARQTGRTTSMLDSLKNGDRIVCLNGREARRLESLCRERELQVKVLVCQPQDAADLFRHSTPEGRTVLDHEWVREMYMRRIEDVERQIDHLQRELSGYGEAHRETARAYAEMSKWRVGKLPPLPGP